MTYTVYHTANGIANTTSYLRQSIDERCFTRERKRQSGKYCGNCAIGKVSKYSKQKPVQNHIHLFVEIPPKMSVSGFMGYLKGKSAAMMYEQFGELKYKYRSKEFWCKGYYVDTVGKNESRIAEYIKNQLKEDRLGDQLSIPL